MLPITPPFGITTSKATYLSKLDFSHLKDRGRRVGAYLTWDFDAELSAVELDTMVIEEKVTQADKVRTVKANRELLNI